MEGEREPCRGMLQTGGRDTNWGVGCESLGWILIFLLSWIEKVFAGLWQMSGMFVSLSNLVEAMLPVLLRKTRWRNRHGKEKVHELGKFIYLRFLFPILAYLRRARVFDSSNVLFRVEAVPTRKIRELEVHFSLIQTPIVTPKATL